MIRSGVDLATRSAISPARRPGEDTVLIVDGALVPTRDRSIAADAGSVWVFESTSSGVTPTGSFTFGAGTLGTVSTRAQLGSTFN